MSVTLEDVRRIALSLPETEEGVSWGMTVWKVKGRLFVWERPLRGSDLKALGDSAPSGAIAAVRVEHLGAKEALLQDASGAFFTTPHFDGSPIVLVELARIDAGELTELVTEAWLDRAPARLATAYLAERP